jgi:rSAM/selenodomain-associated transferase 2
MDKRLTIVVPVLDEAAGIAESLQALAPLRAQGVEVIVVDGGSRDGTAAVCGARADAVLSAPRGRARQMNAGARAARGEVLLFLHADTRLPDGAVAALLDGLRSNQRAWGRFDVAIVGRSMWFSLIAWMMNQRSRWSGIATGDQAIFVTRTAFDAVGGYPDQPLMEDIELSRRLRRLGRPLCLHQRVLTSGRRWEQHGVWRTVVLMWRLRLLYWLGVSAERLARDYR